MSTQFKTTDLLALLTDHIEKFGPLPVEAVSHTRDGVLSPFDIKSIITEMSGDKPSIACIEITERHPAVVEPAAK